MDIKQVHKKHCYDLLKKPNVVSVGIGYKHVKGKDTKQKCIVVGVSKKLPVAALSVENTVPATIDAVDTDVVQMGVITAHPKKIKKRKGKGRAKALVVDPTQKFRPAPPGCSAGHFLITAGTCGLIVKKNGIRHILSNNHVFANSNAAQIGDDIYQPGPHDGGTSADKIGVLADFVPIDFGAGGGLPPIPGCPIAKAIAMIANFCAKLLGRRSRLVAVTPSTGPNTTDCAIALPDNDADIINEIIQIGAPLGVALGTLGMPIQKFGRTTSYTTDTITQTNAVIQVQYGPGQIATFENQFVAGPMSAGGDSGSSILDMNNNVVGLLFAGSDTTTIFNPIQDVFTQLGVSL